MMDKHFNKGNAYNQVERKTWDEFRTTGLLWFVNTTLHLFGWVLVCHVDNDEKVIECYPARTIRRGFSSDANEEGYKKVTRWMAQQGPGLLCDVHTDAVDASYEAWAEEEYQAAIAIRTREAVKVAHTQEANRQEIAGMFLRGNQEAQNKKG